MAKVPDDGPLTLPDDKVKMLTIGTGGRKADIAKAADASAANGALPTGFNPRMSTWITKVDDKTAALLKKCGLEAPYPDVATITRGNKVSDKQNDTQPPDLTDATYLEVLFLEAGA